MLRPKLSTQDSALRTLLLLTLVLGAVRADAMTVMKRDFPELVARAEQIVVATVSEVKEEEDATGTPMTQVSLSDVLYVKGGGPATFTVHFYGGTAGSVTVRVPDMPTFAVGERNVLFIRGNGHDICPLVGVWQGRFRVRHDEERNADVVEDNQGKPLTQLVGRELRVGGADAGDAAAAPDTTAPMTLGEFGRLIAEELAHPHPAGDAQR